MSDVVLFETLQLKGGKLMGIATLNSEKTLNSMSLEMIQMLAKQLHGWEKNADIIFVMFQSAGDRAFSAGGDIQNLYRDMVKHAASPSPYCEAFFEQEYRLDYLIHEYSKPTVAWGHGIVMGGGLGVVSACQFRIGTEKTRIAMPEITIGLIPDAGATWSFSHMEDHWAYFLAWTAANINGRDARRVGLIDHLINHSLKQDLVDQLCHEDWSEGAATVLAHIMQEFEGKSAGFPDGQLESHDQLIREIMQQCFRTDNPVAAFVDALPGLEGDVWLAKAAATFSRGSPTSAHIILEQFRRAGSMTKKETFQLELTLAVQCSRHPDFREGVRALLIEKDNQPVWHPDTMGQVPKEWLDEHFQEPWDEHPMADLAAPLKEG